MLLHGEDDENCLKDNKLKEEMDKGTVITKLVYILTIDNKKKGEGSL